MSRLKNTKRQEIALDQYLKRTLTRYIFIFLVISTIGMVLFYVYQLKFTIDQSLNYAMQKVEFYIGDITSLIDLSDRKTLSKLIDDINSTNNFEVSLNPVLKNRHLVSYSLNSYEVAWSFSEMKAFAFRELDTSFSKNSIKISHIFNLFDNFMRPLIVIFIVFLLFNIIAYFFLYSNLRLNIFNSITHIHSSLLMRNYALPESSNNQIILREFIDLAKAVSNYRDLASLKLKMKLSQDYAHEIKAPVNMILNNLLRIKNSNSSEKRENLLDSTIEKADAVIADIACVLNKFKSQGHYDIEYSNFKLYEVFPKDAAVNSKIEIYGDKTLLKYLFSNLYANASDAASSVEKIKIIINHKNNFLQILISNDGAQNIEDCETLFERGYTTKKNGNGFGLDLSLTIAELHKGRITARKINNDEIEFKVELPICA